MHIFIIYNSFLVYSTVFKESCKKKNLTLGGSTIKKKYIYNVSETHHKYFLIQILSR